MLSFETFARAQAARIEFFHPPGTRRWTFSDWGNALAGECGEAFSLAAHAGIDLQEHVVRKFNEVSRERGCPVLLCRERGAVVATGLA